MLPTPKIKTLDELGVVVRAVENTLTLKGTIDHLCTHHTIDWSAVRKEARKRGILDPASLDKNLRRSIVSFLCTPGSRRHGGDRQSDTLCVKTDVHADAAGTFIRVDDDAVCTPIDQFRTPASPTTPDNITAHPTGSATQIMRRVVRQDAFRCTATLTTSNGVTKRTVEEYEEFTEEIVEVSMPLVAATKQNIRISGTGDIIDRLNRRDPATLSDAVRSALGSLRRVEFTNAVRRLEIAETTQRRELESNEIFETHAMQKHKRISELEADAVGVAAHTKLVEGQHNPSAPIATTLPSLCLAPTASHNRKRARVSEPDRPDHLDTDDAGNQARWLKEAREVWNGMVALSPRVWDARPPADHRSLPEVFAAVRAVVKTLLAPSDKWRVRLLPKSPEVATVYVGSACDVTDRVRRFWSLWSGPEPPREAF